MLFVNYPTIQFSEKLSLENNIAIFYFLNSLRPGKEDVMEEARTRIMAQHGQKLQTVS